MIGWDLILEYAFGAAAVAVRWSGYVNSFLQDLGIRFPPQLTAAPGTELVFYHDRWERLGTVQGMLQGQGLASDQVSSTLASLPHVTASFNLIGLAIIALVTLILVLGIRESANINAAIVIVKVGVVLTFIALAGAFVLRNPEIAAANWDPFIPENTGKYGLFGISGIARGAGVVFFAYIGFDAVSTVAQEVRNSQRNMPIGILGSLAVCTVLYILVSGLLPAVVPYPALNVPDPVAVGVDATGVRWGRFLVKVGAITGLGSVMLVMLLGQSRIFSLCRVTACCPSGPGRFTRAFAHPISPAFQSASLWPSSPLW